MHTVKKVIVVGLDGLEPTIVDSLLAAGELPNLARLKAQGGSARVATTYPAQTPVAWSTFATGLNPGGHGIFDFIRRDPKTYLPDLSFNRYEQKNSFLPPRAVNLRRGTPVWELLSQAGIPSAIVRCPCTYPPDSFRGRMLSGMGVPDVRGGLGTSTFYTTDAKVVAQESESVITLRSPVDGTVASHLLGPRNPKTREHFIFDFVLKIHGDGPAGTLQSEGQPKLLALQPGKWSDWLRIKFKTGLLQSVKGLVRFLLVRTEPHLELYASPINFDPEAPMFPISAPADYAKEMMQRVGTFYTTGMVEDHGGLNNGRFDESAYLQQCSQVLLEREKMLHVELQCNQEGLIYCLFDTPDRLQHMFWRFREINHPANRGAAAAEYSRVIEDHYRACDAIVGRALHYADDQTLFIALSDHGFNSFQRGVNLNTWLHDRGLLALKHGQPGEEAGDFFKNVDWSRTRAYALGLSGLYLNLRGREAEGTVDPEDAPRLTAEICTGLTGLMDSQRGAVAVRNAVPRESVYSGACSAEAPDVVVNCNAGYRISWGTALGGLPLGHFEDNFKKWSGDHIIDPALVPGVLFMNRPFDDKRPRLLDMAPTILAALGADKGPAMEGESLYR